MSKKETIKKTIANALCCTLIYSPTVLAAAALTTGAVIGTEYMASYDEAINEMNLALTEIKNSEAFAKYKANDKKIIDLMYQYKAIKEEKYNSELEKLESDAYVLKFASKYMEAYAEAYNQANEQAEKSKNIADSALSITKMAVPALLVVQLGIAGELTEELTKKSKLKLDRVFYGSNTNDYLCMVENVAEDNGFQK